MQALKLNVGQGIRQGIRCLSVTLDILEMIVKNELFYCAGLSGEVAVQDMLGLVQNDVNENGDPILNCVRYYLYTYDYDILDWILDKAQTQKANRSSHHDTASTFPAQCSSRLINAFSTKSTGTFDGIPLDTSFKGTGQVIFLNSEESGKVLLASLALGDPFTASMAALGSLTSSMVAKHANLDEATYSNGLYSYNGCLVGCAAAVFLSPGSVLGACTLTMVGATTSTFVTASLSQSVAMPQWTLAFNLVTMTALLRFPPTSPPPVDVPTIVTTTSDLLFAPLVGLSQIFVVESAVAGAGVLLAIGLYSPQLAVHALAGSTVGTLTGGLWMGAPAADLAAGLWGYNSALTSMGTAVFFRNNVRSQTLSIAGAAATAVTFGACQSVFSVPCLTLPFCWVMSGCWYLGKGNVVPGLSLTSSPHSPEKNV